VTVHGFVRDVVPLYERANVVLAPTLVSAGTNLKVLEAMAMERAVVASPSGCAGLGMEHMETVWIADGAAAFAEGVITLLRDAGLRARLAGAARRLVEAEFDWTAIGREQAAMWREL
jgi:glycosyltransferase involved in cell wall biosynthesis